ncbi:DUF4031 domain-containing protein [Nitratireductor aquimarinus]|uniref:DUF4031 domain-containing protein n=1 Tax=Alphaproteobacteria TaxID=28211 RepID=UPI0019D37809|nr:MULTISPECIES: DUF4031 domain-containing protein [Alphaproteobacteria]MBN7755509.1 DUF4031 domain-containing protein [Nitratireductor aquimarinus]MBY5998264.1 DUF4031 domain-containing protein [Tritonibacter mobilis]MBY6020293.1 DUF4031 domain-containing protein [Nitratireductor sp. DP7N14-4]
MAVYVDRARHRFGRYRMCHMWSTSRDELFAMADLIGVQRKWFQRPPMASWEHFDITQTKRALAVSAGAIETDKYGPVEHVARLQIASGDPRQIEMGKRRLEQVSACRALNVFDGDGGHFL